MEGWSLRFQAGVICGHGGEPGCADALAGPIVVAGVVGMVGVAGVVGVAGAAGVAGVAGAAGRGEGIPVQDRADIAGWFIGEGVGGEEAEGAGVVVQEF